MFDFIGFIETHSTWAVVIVIGAIALVWLAGRELRDLYEKTNKAQTSVLLQEKVIRDVSESLTRLSETLDELHEKANVHYSDVQRLASDEHWKNCQVDKCPNLPNLLASCMQSNETLTELATLFRQLSLEMIATLRTARNGGGKRGGDDAA